MNHISYSIATILCAIAAIVNAYAAFSAADFEMSLVLGFAAVVAMLAALKSHRLYKNLSKSNPPS